MCTDAFCHMTNFAAAAKSLQSCPTLCDPINGSPPGFPFLGFSRQEHWSGLPFSSPMRESEVAQSCLTLSDLMDCSLPGSSVHGRSFQARVLEWGAIAFSVTNFRLPQIYTLGPHYLHEFYRQGAYPSADLQGIYHKLG